MFKKIIVFFKRPKTKVTLQVDDLEYIRELIESDEKDSIRAAGVLLDELMRHGRFRDYYEDCND